MAIGKNLKKGKKSAEIPSEKPQKEEIKVPSEKNISPISDSNAPAPKNKSLGSKDQLSKLNKEMESGEWVGKGSKMLVVFPVGEEEYAFDINQIKEVVPVPPISPVPQTMNYIKGVANVRGNVLAVVDLSKRFGLKDAQGEKELKYVIVIKSEEVKVAVASHQVPETLMIEEDQIQSSADVMRKTSNEQTFIKGIVKRDNRMIILIDVLEMVQNDQPVNS